MIKRFKPVILALCFIACGFMLGACVHTVHAEQEKPLKIWQENRNGQMETWCVVDDETGVNYVVVAPIFSEKGYGYDGVCITPRLNADGSLYVSN